MKNKTSTQQKAGNGIKRNVSGMCFLRWTKKKPKFDAECIIICGHKWKNEEWEYTLYTIKKTDGENEAGEQCWYWGWFTSSGDEYGDLADMRADIYYVMPLVSGSKKHFR